MCALQFTFHWATPGLPSRLSALVGQSRSAPSTLWFLHQSSYLLFSSPRKLRNTATQPVGWLIHFRTRIIFARLSMLVEHFFGLQIDNLTVTLPLYA